MSAASHGSFVRLLWMPSKIAEMTTTDQPTSNQRVVGAARNQLDVGRSETIAHRLGLMIELAGLGPDDSSTPEILAERLSRAGVAISPRIIRAHLAGSLLPTLSEREAYREACGWHEGSNLLADEPEIYLVPLIQAESCLCEKFLGMPFSRGLDSAHGMHEMSVDELRAYRAELLRTGRLDRIRR